MRMLKWVAGLALAALSTCAPMPASAADVKISAMPAATLPDDAIKLSGVQGSGCATSTTPCSNVTVTTGSLAGYMAGQSSFTGAFQPLNAGLSAIAGMTTTSFGRSLLTQVDAPTARSTLGAQASNTALTQIAGLSPADGDFLERVSGAWANRTAAQVKQDLGIGYTVCKSAVAASVTGSTSETTAATCTIPANALGPNGQIEVIALWTTPNNSNTKTVRVRFGGLSGTLYSQSSLTTVVNSQYYTRIANRNATNSQVGATAGLLTFGSSSGSIVTSSVDTTAAVSLVLTVQLGTSTDTVTLESYLVRLTYGS